MIVGDGVGLAAGFGFVSFLGIGILDTAGLVVGLVGGVIVGVVIGVVVKVAVKVAVGVVVNVAEVTGAAVVTVGFAVVITDGCASA